jgi:hypothetical protein
MRLVRISEQRAIISLHNINWLVFINETECLLRGTDWIFKHNSGLALSFKWLTVSIYIATTKILLVLLKGFKF